MRSTLGILNGLSNAQARSCPELVLSLASAVLLNLCAAVPKVNEGCNTKG